MRPLWQALIQILIVSIIALGFFYLAGAPREALVVSPILVICTASLYQILGRFWIRYRLDNDSVSVILIFVKVVKIPYESVIEATAVTVLEALIASHKHLYRALLLGNRFFVTKAVIIHRRTGLFPWVFITPDEPELFAQAIQERSSRSRRAT
jgi:hypothetical protein